MPESGTLAGAGGHLEVRRDADVCLTWQATLVCRDLPALAEPLRADPASFVIKSVSSNWLLILAQVGAMFFLTPFTIGALGDAQYGAWVLIASITSYLTMLSLGIPMATVRFVAKFAGGGLREELNRTVSSCAGLYLMMGVVSAAVGTVLFFVFDRAYELAPGIREAGRVAFVIVVINVSTSFIGQLPYGIMSAYHDFVVRNRIQLTSVVIKLALTVSLLTYRPTLIWLAVVQIVCFAFEFTVAMWIVHRRYPHIHIRLRSFDKGIVREMVGFSVYVVLLSIGAQLIFQSSALIIGKFLTLEDIPRFAVSGSLATYLMEFVIGIGSVVMPLAATLQARGNLAELREVYLKWSKITVVLTLVSCTWLIVLGPRFLAWWIDPSFEVPAGRVLQILMAANLVFLPARGVALPVLMGLGKPKTAALSFLGAGLLNIVLSVALVKPLGITGVAIGTAVPNVLFTIVVLALAGRELSVTPGEYFRYAVVRPGMAALPLAALLLWFRDGLDVRTFPAMFASGVVALLVGGALAVVFVFRNDPRLNLMSWLAERRTSVGRT